MWITEQEPNRKEKIISRDTGLNKHRNMDINKHIDMEINKHRYVDIKKK